MKELNLDRSTIHTLKDNSRDVLKKRLPAWYEEFLKLLDDWETMAPLYNGFKAIVEIMERKE